MPRTLSDFKEWAGSLETKNYYEILRVPLNATPAQVKAAFHAIALECHPDNFSDSIVMSQMAAAVFKRAVEAYQVLSRPASRKKYDEGLSKGRKRYDAHRLSIPPKPKPVRTLEMVAKTKKGKSHALKADRLLAIGKLEEARVPLVSACQEEPDNAELAERLTVLYEALALEPL